MALTHMPEELPPSFVGHTAWLDRVEERSRFIIEHIASCDSCQAAERFGSPRCFLGNRQLINEAALVRQRRWLRDRAIELATSPRSAVAEWEQLALMVQSPSGPDPSIRSGVMGILTDLQTIEGLERQFCSLLDHRPAFQRHYEGCPTCQRVKADGVGLCPKGERAVNLDDVAVR